MIPMKQKRKVSTWSEFDSSKQYGDYFIVTEQGEEPSSVIVGVLKEYAENFVPKEYHKQIKYWSYEEYIVEAGELKGTIISIAEFEHWKGRGLERYLLPVRVHCWKYTPKGVGWKKYKALEDADAPRTPTA